MKEEKTSVFLVSQCQKLSFSLSHPILRLQLNCAVAKMKRLDTVAASYVLFLASPEQKGAKKLETEEFPPAGLFVRFPPGINTTQTAEGQPRRPRTKTHSVCLRC